MYSREQKDIPSRIPDNYSGMAMKSEGRRNEHDYEQDCSTSPSCTDAYACERGGQTEERPPHGERHHMHEHAPPCEQNNVHNDENDCRRDTYPQKCENDKGGSRGGGIFSSLFGKLGLDGIDSTELIILFAALLLMNDGGKDDDNYIWIVLLLLLIIK